MFLGFIIRKLRFLNNSRRSVCDDSTENHNSAPKQEPKIKKQLSNNLDCLKEMLSGSSDLKIHPFRFGPDGKFTGTLAFIDAGQDRCPKAGALGSR